MTSSTKYCIALSAIDPEDSGLVGEQAAKLAQLRDVPVLLSPGVVITTRAYYAFLHYNHLDTKIETLLSKVSWKDESTVQKAALEIQKEILHGKVPDEVVAEVFDFYKKMGGFLKLATVSLQASLSINQIYKSAGITYEAHFLHIHGESEVLVKMKEIWAGFFEYSWIKQRYLKRVDLFSIGIAIIMTKTLAATSSGILFTGNPLTGDKQTMLIEAVFGLEQLLLKDSTSADRYEVAKTTGAILQKKIASQHIGLFLRSNQITEVKLKNADAEKQKISDEQIKKLVTIGKHLQKMFYFPQQLIWTIEDGMLYALTCHQMTSAPLPTAESASTNTALLKGIPVCPGIVTGTVALVNQESDIAGLHSGEIAVTSLSDLKHLRALSHAAGIIVEKEMTVSIAVTLAHEIRQPVIVGMSQATKLLKHHMVITMNGSTGEVHQGGYGNRANTLDPLTHTAHTITKLYADLTDSSTSIETIKHTADGIIMHGAESILLGIGVHPKQLIQEKRQNEYIKALVTRLDELCTTVSPRPVIFEFSDSETAVLKKLAGGKEYEPKEPNPHLGFHGAFRNQFDHTVLDMEVTAITFLRTKKNHKNLWMSIPFVRTPKELEHIKKLLTSKNLYRTPTCKVFLTVDVPANSVLLEKYLDQGIDGVIIRPEKLACLLLGIDFSHPELQQYFSLNDEAILSTISHISTVCSTANMPMILAQSSLIHFPELIKKYVKEGIGTLSVAPVDIQPTRVSIAELETTT